QAQHGKTQRTLALQQLNHQPALKVAAHSLKEGLRGGGPELLVRRSNSSMAQTTDEDCGICLDALTNPVALPCRHNFCSNCLESWRSKYGSHGIPEKLGRACPLCREKIPPSKEMVILLKFWRDRVKELETDENASSLYAEALKNIERLEHEVGDWTDAIEYSGGEEYLELPNPNNPNAYDVQQILDWLGPPPVDKRRINATDPNFGNASLIVYSMPNPEFLSILLQFGADVNAVHCAAGATVFTMALRPLFYPQARMLLEWGADTTPTTQMIEIAESRYGNMKLANLLSSELGGRRCELINFSTRPNLNGKTCLVEKYLPERDRYKITFEGSQEKALAPPDNLKRRDRTPTDCGYYITFNNGKFSRREFASKEECQAFVAEVEANGLAGQLAQLHVSSSNAKGKSGKKGRKKKGGKGRK
ncbi:hypothetical protein ACHAXT_007634, partial [Thalassiosira profunda]